MQMKMTGEIVNGHILAHLNLLDTTVKWLGQWMRIVDDQDKRLLEDLHSVFLKIYETLWRYQQRLQSTYPSAFPVLIAHTGGPGRPPYVIPLEFLEVLRGLGFTWTKIAAMFKVSRWTVMRRFREHGLQNLAKFSNVSDQEVDEIINAYISRHGSTTC
jgi:AraC-like DNA-binding protein